MVAVARCQATAPGIEVANTRRRHMVAEIPDSVAPHPQHHRRDTHHLLRDPRRATIPPLADMDARVLEHTGTTLTNLRPYTKFNDDDVPEPNRIVTHIQGEIFEGVHGSRVKHVGFLSLYRGRDARTTADHFVRLFDLIGLGHFAPELRLSFDRYQRETGNGRWGVYEAGNIVVVLFRDEIPYQGGLTSYYAYIFERTLFAREEREEMRRREPRNGSIRDDLIKSH